MSKSKNKFVKEQEDLFEDLVGDDTELEDGFDGRTIYPIFNKETNKYEYLYIYVDELNKKVVKTELVTTKHDNPFRAHQDILKHFAEFFVKNKK